MKSKILLVLTAFVFLWSCQPNPVVPETEKIHYLKSFTISVDNNGDKGMKENPLIVHIGGNIFVTVNEGTDITKLVPTLVSGDDVNFFINNQPVVSDVTEVDFSETANLVLQSPEGEMAYTILLKTGNKRIDAQVYNIMATHGIPGISVSATKDEKLVYSYGYGFANEETKERVTPKHLFRLASMTKSQTALCIMTLMERGKLKITDRMFGAGGWFEKEFGTDIVSGADQITIQNFLEHTSGWSDEHIFTSSYGLGGKDVMERMNHILHTIPLDNPPGTKYEYYNMGYGILGELVEKISGKDYETFLREDVYAKAGVKDIWVGGDRNHRRPNEVIYYSQDGRNGYGNDMDLIKSLGGLIASTDELMQVMASIDYGTDVPDILKPSTLDVMYTPSEVGNHQYSLGWRTNHSLFTSWENYHGGTLAGTGTLWARDKDSHTAAVVLCNSRSYIGGFDNSLYDLLNIVMTNI